MTHNPNPDGNYLIAYGANRNLGWFVGQVGADKYPRGACVIVRTERGLEEGLVLSTSIPIGVSSAIKFIPGVIIGRADEHQNRLAEQSVLNPDKLFDEARETARELGLPLNIIDLEVLFEPITVVLHVLLYRAVDLSSLQVSLAARWSTRVIMQDVTNPEALSEAADTGCQSCGTGGGCGSEKCGSGGCSSGGSCGSGAGTSKQFQEQWKNYFAELRQGMERRSEASHDEASLHSDHP